MWVDIEIDNGERFPAMVDRMSTVLVPLARCSPEAKRIAIHWPGYERPIYRLLTLPEPAGAGLLRFALDRDGSQDSLDY